MPLHAGKMNQRVTIQQRAAGADSLGQANGAWQDVVTVWAHVQPLRGAEFFAAGQTQSDVDVRVFIRHRTGITPQMRLLWRDVPHDIESVIEPYGGREQLELMCVSGVRDGR